MTRYGWINKAEKVALGRQCALAGVCRATLYARQRPKAPVQDDDVLKRLIDEEYTRSPFYGSRKMVAYLQRCGHSVNRKRVQRLMRTLDLAGMAPGPNTSRAHPQHKVYPYLLRGVAVTQPNQVWSTDITYIRTHEGWLYLAAVLDLHSRAVVGWSMGSRMQTTLVLDALTMAVWRRKPKDSVIIHSDQGSQFGSDEFNRWCKDNRLSPSMSRRGNCWDNAVAESFFSSLKSEQIKKRIYQTRAEAKSEIFDYIEGFYNRVRRHKHLDQLSPQEFERQRQTAL